MKSILEVDSVLKEFGEQQLLTDIYLKCETSDIIGLLGRNGCGKSTLLKIIFGTVQAQRKFIRIDNKVLDKPYLKSNLICYLPQHDFLPRNMLVSNVVKLYEFQNYSIFFDDGLLEKVQKQKIYTLSGGELRYLEIRLLLNTNCKFLMLDEPFNGISPVVATELKMQIKEAARKKGIILTDHSYKNVMDVATECFLLYDGGLKKIEQMSDLRKWNYLYS